MLIPKLFRPRNRRPIRSVSWQLTELERREMLAADAGVAMDATATLPAIQAVQEVGLPSSPTAEAVSPAPAHLVIVDSAVSESDVWNRAIPDTAEIAVLSEGVDPIDQISQILAGRSGLKSVHLISHGTSGELMMAGESWTQETMMDRADEIQRWRGSMAPGADLLIYGCDFAADDAGRQLASSLAELLNVDVAASTDRTGARLANANWNLEFQVGAIEFAAVLDQSALQRYRGHLGIEIWAAGQTTDELMQLEINGQIVDTWFVRDTDADAGQFLPYFYNVDGISADSVRINFVNDLYDPQNGIDRNLRIDRLVIDGVTYETEDPSVFSTGTWKPEDGVTPGFRQSEYLSNNGYFQFSSNGGSPGGGNGSRIDIEAAGDTGDEAIQLLIDENVVATYLNISTSESTYTYFADQNVTADRVRVQFIGSVYEPQNNYDQNVRVDRVVIDGVGFESEAASTFSTGTFVAGQGVVPGNWQSEYLHADGYFQYSEGGGGNPGGGGGGGNAGSFSLASGAVTVIEGQDSVTVRVERIGGSDGEASIDIFTAGETAGAGQDFVEKADRLFFGDGETVKTFTVNLLDDGIAEATEEFSIRLDNPAGAGLLAPRTSLITILDDDSGLPRYDSFNSSAGLTLNGNANVNGGELELTAAGNRQAGTAFFQSPISVNGSTSFQSAFSFRIGGGFGTAGADGFTFLMQNSSQGPNALGQAGGHMAYDNINNSLAVEFDNYLKGSDAASTIAVVINGNTANPILEVPAPFDLNNGTQYYAWVDYNGDSNNLAVYLSTDAQKPSLAILKTNVDLAQIVGNSAYAGFTAGNFDLPNYHRISSWNFSLDAPPADPPVIPSGIIAEQDIYSGLNQPLSVDWSADGRNIYIGEKGGVIKVARDGSNLQTLIDISAQVNNVSDRGMVDFALHPDFLNNGYVYLLYTYDPPEVFNHVGNPLAGPDGTGNRAGRLLRVQADASTGFTTIIPGSETVLLGTNSTWNNFNAFTDSTTDFNEPEAGRTAGGGYVRDFIKSDSLSHTVGSLAFGLDGSLFVSIGDGASYNRTDVRALSVQNVDSLSGKVLRIDPFTGRGYSDNPFFNGDTNANRSKVYQLGLRNPWRLTVDPRTGQLYIGETGLASFEEINTGGPGENFGWPFYEGSQGVNNRTPGYQNLPQAGAFYASGQGKPASIALEHRAGSNVVVLGDVVYNNNLGAEYEGDLFFADLYRGSVGHANIGANGEPFAAETFVTGAEFVVDIRQGPDGSLYYVNLLEGTVGRWMVV